MIYRKCFVVVSSFVKKFENKVGQVFEILLNLVMTVAKHYVYNTICQNRFSLNRDSFAKKYSYKSVYESEYFHNYMTVTGKFTSLLVKTIWY